MQKLQTQWIVGFTDGEGCFFIGINKNSTMKQGLQILPEFTIVQHKKNIQTLYALKDYFQCGVVRTNHGDRMCYRVRGQKNLVNQILPFFEKHPLKTTKQIDFKKFRRVVLMIEQKQHLNEDGISKIRKIKNCMNL
jgi:hypothetical protein